MRAVAAVHENQSALPARVLTCIASLTACCAAFAADLKMPQVEVSTATLPRFDGADPASRSSRMDITLLPQQRSALGVAFGMSSISGTHRTFGPADPVAIPSIDFGVHWRYTFDSHYRFDVTAYRRVPNSDAISLIESREPSYGARVELGLGSMRGKSKGFVADRGFLGLQLESGARVTVKRRNGGPMFYYRNTF